MKYICVEGGTVEYLKEKIEDYAMIAGGKKQSMLLRFYNWKTENGVCFAALKRWTFIIITI